MLVKGLMFISKRPSSSAIVYLNYYYPSTHEFHNYSIVLQVVAFCDVDQKKLAKNFYTYEESEVNKNENN